MVQWSDQVLDEDIEYFRYMAHNYDFLLDRVVPRELRAQGFTSADNPGHENNLKYDLIDHLTDSGRRPPNRRSSPAIQHLIDYEDALVARYATHLRTWWADPRWDKLEPHDQALEFDSHVERTSHYNEQDWINVLGFHPVDLPKNQVLFRTPHRFEFNYLENKTMKAVAVEQTSDIRQQRLDQLHLNLIEGATNFVQILDRAKQRNPSHYPSQPREHKLKPDDKRDLFENVRLMGSEDIRDIPNFNLERYPMFNSYG